MKKKRVYNKVILQKNLCKKNFDSGKAVWLERNLKEQLDRLTFTVVFLVAEVLSGVVRVPAASTLVFILSIVLFVRWLVAMFSCPALGQSKRLVSHNSNIYVQRFRKFLFLFRITETSNLRCLT